MDAEYRQEAVERGILDPSSLPDVGKESIASRALKKPGDAWRDSFGFFHAKNNYSHEYFFDASWNCYYLAPDQWIDSAGTIYWEDAKGIRIGSIHPVVQIDFVCKYLIFKI